MAKRKKRTKAQKADRYDLYLQSVQAPDVDVRFFKKVYKGCLKAEPKVLREDFCGTAAVCCEWVRLNKEYEAYGVDLDPQPLAWGEEHNLGQLKPKQKARVHLLEGDVRSATSAPADIIAAQNFSYCIFKTRDGLRDYFKAAYENLATKGVMVLDLFGGYEAIEDGREDVTEHSGFKYVWEQAKFDPITHDALFHIHFRFSDRSELEQAFTYDWRLWTIPEVREVLLEAGFDETHVYWEGTDKETGEGNGVFKRRKHGDSDPAWNAYIVGVRNA